IYIMEPDSARQASIARRISEGLRALKDPGTGRPMVEAVHRREEIYHGPGLALMPDLIAIPAPGFMCNSVCRMDGPLVEEVDPEKEFVVGRHHREGIIAACGGGIAEKIGVRADIIDAAPTILYCMGLAIPENCDGGVVASLFTEDFLAARGTPRISGQKTSVTAGIAEPVYSAEDEREIQQKLRDLGYM
ncbi:MAG TPA: hypothetical protein VLH60_08325, partial [Sedimentisphaerales bacterium]|nr:hypothetical protein [Sedimentisphaerales bacterium]